MSGLTLTYTLRAALLAVLALAACSGDEDGGAGAAADAAGPDVPAGICQPANCQAQPRPPVTCPSGTTAEFSCSRTLTGRCEWANARCSAAGDAAAADAAGEAGTDVPGGDAGVDTDNAGEEAGGADAPDAGD